MALKVGRPAGPSDGARMDINGIVDGKGVVIEELSDVPAGTDAAFCDFAESNVAARPSVCFEEGRSWPLNNAE